MEKVDMVLPESVSLFTIDSEGIWKLTKTAGDDKFFQHLL